MQNLLTLSAELSAMMHAPHLTHVGVAASICVVRKKCCTLSSRV
jgi:hypothetical protein